MPTTLQSPQPRTAAAASPPLKLAATYPCDAMWMSNVLIVVDRNNPDHNSLADLAAAVADVGGENVVVDEDTHLIECDIPTHDVVVIAAMDGIAYVRNVFSYFKDQSPQEAA